jgi:hypothetical protein
MERESAKIHVLYNEFPFLENYVKSNVLTEAPKVQRVDIRLLNQVPCQEHWVHGRYIRGTRYFIVGANGTKLDEVRRHQRVERKRKCFLEYDTWSEWEEGETVYDGIQRIAGTKQVRLIIEVWITDEIPHIIVHKVPNNPDWFTALLKQVEDELHTQLADIDNV